MSQDMPALFAARLAANPDALAVVDDKSSRSYAEIDAESAGYAAALARHGVGRETVVAIVADRGPQYVAMVLGVLRAGAAFMPVEPSTPPRRALGMCAAARARVLMVQPGHEAYAADLVDGTDRVVLTADAHLDGPAGEPVARDPEGLAYVIFTSGSTGTPKGAMVVDGGMDNHIAAKVLDLGLGGGDVVGLTAPLSFDISVWQSLTSLTVGGSVAVASPVNLSEPVELVGWVQRHGVTVLEIVPSFLAVLVDELGRDAALRSALGSLRFLVATGEALPAELARRWYEHCPDIVVVNAYGPTECSDDVTHHVVTAAECGSRAWPPIGREIINTRVYVVDSEGREIDGDGELLVGGRGVGRGYIGDPVRTALAFVPDHLSGAAGERLYRTGDRGSRAADGTIDFHGRRDRQVKVRGHRVELGDVESELLRVPGVLAAACVFSLGKLHAFVTIAAGSAADHILDAVRASAPKYLVPHEVTVLDRMPTNTAGKVDHRALRDRVVGPVTTRAPADDTDPAAVRALVADVLDVAEIGADDDFFAAGGDSLRAMTLVSLARERFAADGAQLRGFLADPTPRGLLAVLRAARAAPPPVHTEPATGALSSGQERLWFLEQLNPRKKPLLIRLELTLRGALDPRALQHAVDAVVARHEPLRTVFTQERGVPRATVWPEAKVTVNLAEPGADLVSDVVDSAGLSARTGQPPLMAVGLARVAADHHVLVIVLHHLVADGWTLAVLRSEIARYYQRWVDGQPEVPMPRTTFTRYVGEERRWLAGPDAEQAQRYWTEQLAGAAPTIDLPLDRPRPAKPDYATNCVVVELTEAETSALVATARAMKATPFMAAMAAFYAVLRELTATADLVIGIDSVNRSWPDSEELIGTFVNQLPVRLTAQEDTPTFGDLLKLARRQLLGAYEHDRLPFHKIVAAVNPPRRAGRFPLFQVKLTHQSAWQGAIQLPNIEVMPSEISDPVMDADLMLDITGESDRLRLELLYLPELLDEDTAAAWVEAIAGVLRAGAGDPDTVVAPVVARDRR
ncbi:Pyoverdine chromophore precursor synthetase PvdL @ Siderophore biosynthesis non-ribosomal peptide synthetase modules [Alloactinosynnema sp. L-07]|uniref:non-ribosomal peptide synthetase n=1 Tax=Alloactinosynnema sp. L-07 TaxID=1653480 RepID=UPI00065F0A14|nr:non-ribosomal peptide synthetase [Alloactinosynnema sp. L-07]CRK56743.1 Pyoverdine chromophore precursor synthetase PvdL @ Siderophore biosynthesis non-ribosomal peptide synthetase modules [Alloactinosynnema sp. L-07]